MFRKRTVDDIFRLKIILYFVLPIILMAGVIVAEYKLNVRQYYNMYNEYNDNYADKIFADIDDEINKISQMDYWLKDYDAMSKFDDEGYMSDEDYSKTVKHMIKLKNDFDIIDSILVINRKTEQIIATNGKSSLDKYFNDVSVYKDYSADFFKTVRYPSDSMIILPPTIVEIGNNSTKYLMPVIKMASPGENPNRYFVFNISIDSLLKKYAASEYTDNTIVCFANKKNKQIYSLALNNNLNVNDQVWSSIIDGQGSERYKDISGKQYNIIVKTVSPNLMNYAYVVFIPVDDINKMINAATLKTVAISVIIYLIIAGIAFVIASNVGNYLGRLIKRLNFSEEVGIRDIFNITDKISAEFQGLLDDNKNMKAEINNMVIDVKEKMITDVINNKERPVKMTLYKYTCFLPVIFHISSTVDMPDNELSIIKERLYRAVFDYFKGKYEVYDITNSKDDVHLVLNIPETLNKSELQSEIEKLADIVFKNKIDVTLNYHIGEKCDSFDLLRNEYLRLVNLSDSRDVTNDGDSEFNNGFRYRVSESNAIINGVLAGDRDVVVADIERIIIANIINNVSKENMKLLYKSIINTLITALKFKQIDVDKVIANIGEDVYFHIDEKSDTDKAQYILDLIDAAIVNDKNTDEAFMSEVMKYIDDNYTDYDITLERVASRFNTDVKKLSKKIKQYNNITFHKYITELRIEDAKRLLITTDMSVEQIYTAVGYISRATFMRAFDAGEHITPSEYRKKYRKH